MKYPALLKMISHRRFRFCRGQVLSVVSQLSWPQHPLFVRAQAITDIPGYSTFPSCVTSALSSVLTPAGFGNPDCPLTVTAPISIASCACLDSADSVNVNNMVYDVGFGCGGPNGIYEGDYAEDAFNAYCSLFSQSFAVLLAEASSTFTGFDYEVKNMPGYFGIPRCARSALSSAFLPGAMTGCPTVADPSDLASCGCLSDIGLTVAGNLAGQVGPGCRGIGIQVNDVINAYNQYCTLYTRQSNAEKAATAPIPGSATTTGGTKLKSLLHVVSKNSCRFGV